MIAEFARNNPLLPRDDKKAIEVRLKQRLGAYLEEYDLQPTQKTLKSPQDVHYYIGRLDMNVSASAYVIQNGKLHCGFYKEPGGPYEIYETGKSTSDPKQIYSMLDYYSYCADFIKSLNDDITVTEFVESKGKEEEGEPTPVKRKRSKKEEPTLPKKKSRQKKKNEEDEKPVEVTPPQPLNDKMEIDEPEKKEEEEEEVPVEKKPKKKRTSTRKKKSEK